MTLSEAKRIVASNGYAIRRAQRLIEKLERMSETEYAKFYEYIDSRPKLHEFLTTIVCDLPEKYQYLFTGQFAKTYHLLTVIDGFYEDVHKRNVHSYFVKDGDDFIGFVYYTELKDDHTVVNDCGAFDFDTDNSSKTMFHDVLQFPSDLIATHRVVRWDVYNKNKAKRAYDYYIKRHNGVSRSTENQTFYELRNDGNEPWST